MQSLLLLPYRWMQSRYPERAGLIRSDLVIYILLAKYPECNSPVDPPFWIRK